jgi:hypothetical protein
MKNILGCFVLLLILTNPLLAQEEGDPAGSGSSSPESEQSPAEESLSDSGSSDLNELASSEEVATGSESTSGEEQAEDANSGVEQAAGDIAQTGEESGDVANVINPESNPDEEGIVRVVKDSDEYAEVIRSGALVERVSLVNEDECHIGVGQIGTVRFCDGEATLSLDGRPAFICPISAVSNSFGPCVVNEASSEGEG